MPFLYYGYGASSFWYGLLIITFIFSLWAQFKVNSTFSRFSKVASKRGITGYDAARMILDRNGLSNVKIEHISGSLTDHYDPKSNIVRLSDSVYGSNSVAAIGVAAHECGHAVQYATEYGPIKLRMAIIPATRIGSGLAVPLVFLGIIFSMTGLAYIGVAFFALSTFFQLVTLPVEFNASSRALETLEGYGTLDDSEMKGARKVLTAAAMTYVAALASSIVNLLRLMAIASSGSKRR